MKQFLTNLLIGVKFGQPVLITLIYVNSKKKTTKRPRMILNSHHMIVLAFYEVPNSMHISLELKAPTELWLRSIVVLYIYSTYIYYSKRYCVINAWIIETHQSVATGWHHSNGWPFVWDTRWRRRSFDIYTYSYIIILYMHTC